MWYTVAVQVDVETLEQEQAVIFGAADTKTLRGQDAEQRGDADESPRPPIVGIWAYLSRAVGYTRKCRIWMKFLSPLFYHQFDTA